MGETPKAKVEYREAKFEIDTYLFEKFQLPGFKIQLLIDHRGYLTAEPKFLDGQNMECDVNPPGSFVGYRVRLRHPDDDPDTTDADPFGCVLINGRWRC